MASRFCRLLVCVIALSGIVVLAMPVANAATLYKYDDFSPPEISEVLWARETASAGGVITYDGSKAVLDLTQAAQPKTTRIRATLLTPMLTAEAPVFRITWDQAIIADSLNCWNNGAYIRLKEGTGVPGWMSTGQVGTATNGVAKGKFFVNDSSAQSQQYTIGNWYHFDVSIASNNTQTVKVYQYDWTLNNDPEAYATSGTLLQTLNGTNSWTANTPIVVRFYVANRYGDDTTAVSRGMLGVDNVWSSMYVEPIPEPSALLVLSAGIMGMAGLAVRRRR